MAFHFYLKFNKIGLQKITGFTSAYLDYKKTS